MTPLLPPEEYIEQSYFFRALRERILDQMPIQEILFSLDQEILSTTKLPLAIQFLATEIKHSGQLCTGFKRLGHYFTPFQIFVVEQAEQEGMRFTMNIALLILEREAFYRAQTISKSGLFVYQFETLSRNRLGYLEGISAISADPFYDEQWKSFISDLRRQIGLFELSELIYLRSDLYIMEQRREDPDYSPPKNPIFTEKEGKIAKASRNRDPLFFFAALNRQLKYPEVPRLKASDSQTVRLDMMTTKLRELETRLKLLEGETRGNIDWNTILGSEESRKISED